jgi:ankyrin repeat protein
LLPRFRLFEAISRGSREDVEEALAAGAKLSDRDLDGRSCLHWAGESKQIELARFLIGLGADVNEALEGRDRNLLMFAIRRGNLGFAELLLECGANPDVEGPRGTRPMHLAAKEGYAYFVRSLLGREASLTSRDHKGNSPMHYAAIHGKPDVIREILRNGPDLHLCNKRNFTPIEEAAAHGHADAVSALRSHYRFETLERAKKVAEAHGHEKTVLGLLAEPPSSYFDQDETSVKTTARYR